MVKLTSVVVPLFVVIVLVLYDYCLILMLARMDELSFWSVFCILLHFSLIVMALWSLLATWLQDPGYIPPHTVYSMDKMSPLMQALYSGVVFFETNATGRYNADSGHFFHNSRHHLRYKLYLPMSDAEVERIHEIEEEQKSAIITFNSKAERVSVNAPAQPDEVGAELSGFIVHEASMDLSNEDQIDMLLNGAAQEESEKHQSRKESYLNYIEAIADNIGVAPINSNRLTYSATAGDTGYITSTSDAPLKQSQSLMLDKRNHLALRISTGSCSSDKPQEHESSDQVATFGSQSYSKEDIAVTVEHSSALAGQSSQVNQSCDVSQ